MSNLSNYGRDYLLALIPSGLYIAFCSSLPTASQTGATIPELSSTGGYARVAVTYDAASGGSRTISSAINSSASSAAYSAGATHYAIVDSPTIGAGNLWFFAPLGSTLTVSAANQVAQIAASTIAESLS